MSCSSFEERVASLEAFVTLWRVAGEIESSRKKVKKQKDKFLGVVVVIVVVLY